MSDISNRQSVSAVIRYLHKTYVGIRLIDKLLFSLIGDNRGADHDRDVGQAGVGDVIELVEDILASQGQDRDGENLLRVPR